MHQGLAQFWPSTSVQNQGCSVTDILGKLGKTEQPDDDIKIRSRAICLPALSTEDRHSYCQRAKVVPL